MPKAHDWNLSVVAGLLLLCHTAGAQEVGPPRSLGGYGGSMSNLASGMPVGGPVIPYAGSFGGFMPYRMGGGSGLAFQSRSAPAMTSGRAAFSLAPMGRSMASMSGGGGLALGRSSRLSLPTAGGAMGAGPGMSGTRSMGVMPPNFGYPFRPPTNLITPAGPAMGMSM